MSDMVECQYCEKEFDLYDYEVDEYVDCRGAYICPECVESEKYAVCEMCKESVAKTDEDFGEEFIMTEDGKYYHEYPCYEDYLKEENRYLLCHGKRRVAEEVAELEGE